MKPNKFLQKHLLLYSLMWAFGVAIFASCKKENIQPTDQTESTVNASAAETTPPTVKFTFPVAGATVSDSITIKIKATDNVAVASVQCKVDGKSLGKKTTGPYDFGWNTRTVMNGTHQLLAKAVDASGNSRTKKITVTTANPGILPMEQGLIDLINAERIARGLIPLTPNSKLVAAARFHSNDMAVNFFYGHIGSGDDTLGDRLDDQGYAWTSATENLAGGQTTAQQVFDAWIANTEQRFNMLDPSLKDVGIGCGYNKDAPYKSYWTGVFAKTD